MDARDCRTGPVRAHRRRYRPHRADCPATRCAPLSDRLVQPSEYCSCIANLNRTNGPKSRPSCSRSLAANNERELRIGHAARIQKTLEAVLLPALGNTQFDNAGQRLPVRVAVAVALGRPKRAKRYSPGHGRKCRAGIGSRQRIIQLVLGWLATMRAMTTPRLAYAWAPLSLIR